MTEIEERWDGELDDHRHWGGRINYLLNLCDDFGQRTYEHVQYVLEENRRLEEEQNDLLSYVTVLESRLGIQSL